MELYNAPIGIDNWGMQGAGFFPFNNFTDANKWGTTDKYNANIALIDQNLMNYHYGMSLSTEFEVPEGNVVTSADGTTSDIVFNFSGDDDVWIFVDGKLVLDIGGIHEAMSGSINFTKGTYTVNNKTANLTEKLSDYNTDAWKKGTSHTLDIFYMERGGTLSNNLMSFNMLIPKFYVAYDANGADGSVVDDNAYKANDKATVLSGNTLTKDGYMFTSWNTEPDGTGVSYSADDVLIISDDITLYAQWEKIPDSEPEPEPSQPEPSEPEQPSEPEPSQPEPSEPEQPSEPEPSQPEQSSSPTNEPVNTGDNTGNIALIAALMASFATTIVLVCKKKKSDARDEQ